MGINNIEQDIISFFKVTESQNYEDQRKTLRLLLEKYTHLNKSEYLMDVHDLKNIVSSATSIFANKTMPMFLGSSRSKVMENDQKHVCLIEATIFHMGKIDCLKRLPKFNYKDDRF